MSVKKALGRGMDSLIPTNFDKNILDDNSERIQKLLIKDITTNSDQPRKHFDEVSIKELASSIKRYGVLQPLIASPKKGGGYKLVAGERRLRASEKAGLDKVPVIVRERKELEQLEVALIENVQRVDLSPIEQAVSIERLHQQFNVSYQEIASRLGKAKTTVANIVRLLNLPKAALDALNMNKISEGHARAILALNDSPNKQIELLELIISNGLAVRQAEKYVQNLKNIDIDKTTKSNPTSRETAETKRIGNKLGAKVTLNQKKRGGKLEVHYSNDKEFKILIEKLSKI